MYRRRHGDVRSARGYLESPKRPGKGPEPPGPRIGFGLINARIPGGQRSSACISSRITTVIQVTDGAIKGTITDLMSHSQFHCTGRVYLHVHGLIFETSICYWQDQPGSPSSGAASPPPGWGGRAARRGPGSGGRPPRRGGDPRGAAGPGGDASVWVEEAAGRREDRPRPPPSPVGLDVALSRGGSAGGCLAEVPGAVGDDLRSAAGGPGAGLGRREGRPGTVRRDRPAGTLDPRSARPRRRRRPSDRPDSPSGPGRLTVGVRGADGGPPRAGRWVSSGPATNGGTRRRDGGPTAEAFPGRTGGGVEAPPAARDLRGRGLGALSPPRREAVGIIGPSVRRPEIVAL